MIDVTAIRPLPPCRICGIARFTTKAEDGDLCGFCRRPETNDDEEPESFPEYDPVKNGRDSYYEAIDAMRRERERYRAEQKAGLR